MTVLYHPDFAGDIRRFSAQYAEISPKLASRFYNDVDTAIHHIKTDPTAAGHFLNTGSLILREVRRRNLKVFPFFLLYGLDADRLVFGSLIPGRADPLNWMGRFE